MSTHSAPHKPPEEQARILERLAAALEAKSAARTRFNNCKRAAEVADLDYTAMVHTYVVALAEFETALADGSMGPQPVPQGVASFG